LPFEVSFYENAPYLENFSALRWETPVLKTDDKVGGNNKSQNSRACGCEQ
jgi:hypothetical protein